MGEKDPKCPDVKEEMKWRRPAFMLCGMASFKATALNDGGVNVAMRPKPRKPAAIRILSPSRWSAAG